MNSTYEFTLKGDQMWRLKIFGGLKVEEIF